MSKAPKKAVWCVLPLAKCPLSDRALRVECYVPNSATHSPKTPNISWFLHIEFHILAPEMCTGLVWIYKNIWSQTYLLFLREKKLFYMLWINRGISERQDDGTNMSVLLTDWCLHGYSFSAAKLGHLDCLAKYSCNSSKLFQPGQCKATESWMSLFTCW